LHGVDDAQVRLDAGREVPGVSVCLLESCNLKLFVGRRAAVADWRLG